MSRLGKLAALALASLAMASAARAEVNLCNDFHAPIRVALAQPISAAIAATGWWKLDPGVCHPVDYTLEGTELYYTAVSDGYRQGFKMLRHNWGNQKPLHVGARNFNFADAAHARGATAMFGVASVPASGRGKTVTVTIHFVDGGTTVRTSTR